MLEVGTLVSSACSQNCDYRAPSVQCNYIGGPTNIVEADALVNALCSQNCDYGAPIYM